MRPTPTSGVTPDVLRWARTTIGLSPEEVAHKLKRSADDIVSWESGHTSPSYSQLEKLAYEVYKRPLAIFFLPSAPEEDLPQQEFRSLPDSDLLSLQPDTRLRIRSAHAYQLALKELFDGKNPGREQIWHRLRLTLRDSVIEQSAAIRDQLGISISEQAAWKDNDQALKIWRSAIEASGVFVFKWTFKQDDISGLSLPDAEFPIIYINNSTARSRQIFSLFHELSHILLNVGGICKDDARQVNQLPHAVKDIELFCNRIAAEVLVPSSDFAAQVAGLPQNADQVGDQLFADIAARYCVSREVILRRLFDQGRISTHAYAEKVDRWQQHGRAGSGGNYYATINTYLSNTFAREVVRQHSRNRLTIEQAAEMLGVKVRNFADLEQQILRGEAA